MEVVLVCLSCFLAPSSAQRSAYFLAVFEKPPVSSSAFAAAVVDELTIEKTRVERITFERSNHADSRVQKNTTNLNFAETRARFMLDLGKLEDIKSSRA